MGKTALIILDVQNCFINDKTKYLPIKIKEHLEKQKYDFLIFSKFVNLESSNFSKRLNWEKSKNSPEIDIVPELLEIASKNQIFEKNTYSIFKSQDFLGFLRENNIKKLVFCGLDLDACILASVFEAFDLGFNFEILFELTDSSSKENVYNSANEIIKRNL